jgi:hypothetical protein
MDMCPLRALIGASVAFVKNVADSRKGSATEEEADTDNCILAVSQVTASLFTSYSQHQGLAERVHYSLYADVFGRPLCQADVVCFFTKS